MVGFNDHSQITQDFTDDPTLLAAGVHRLRNGGGTALYDAIYRACHNKLIKGQDRASRAARDRGSQRW